MLAITKSRQWALTTTNNQINSSKVLVIIWKIDSNTIVNITILMVRQYIMTINYLMYSITTTIKVITQDNKQQNKIIINIK